MKPTPLLSLEALKVFESLPDLYLILSPELVILTASNAYLAATVTERSFVVGRHLLEVFPGNPAVPEKDTEALLTSLRQVLSTGKPHQMAIQRYEVEQPARLGGSLVEKYCIPSNTPVLDEQGGVIYIIHKVMDVTEVIKRQSHTGFPRQTEALHLALQRAQEAERKLKEEQRRLKEAQAIGHIGSFERDVSSGQICWSDELYRIHGLEPKHEAITIEKVLSFVPADDRKQLSDAIQALEASGKPLDLTARIVRTDGEVRYLHRKAYLLKNATGKSRIYGIVQDISERVAAEEKVRASEALLREAEVIGQMGSYEGDLATFKFRFSENMYRLLGQEPYAVTPTLDWIDSLSHPEDALVVRKVIGQAVLDKWPYQYQRRIYRPDGEMRCIESHGKVICDAWGNAIKIMGTARDITGRKQAEAQIREQADFISQVTEAVPGTISIFDLEQKKIVYINRKQFTRLGYSEEELEAMSPMHWIEQIGHPEDKQAMQEHVEGMASAGDDHIRSLDFRIRNKAGAWEWRRTRAKVFKRDGSGRPLQYISLAQDITHEKQAERQLQESKDMLQSVFDSTLNAISVYQAVRDQAGQIVDFQWRLADPVMISGYADGTDLVGKRYSQVFPGFAESGILARFREVVESGTRADFEIDYSHKGTTKWFRIIAVKLADGLVATTEDITERKRVEKENLELKLQGQKKLLNAILDAQEEERRRLSESLHNGVGQILYAAKLNLDRIDLDRLPQNSAQVNLALQTAETLLAEAIRDTRRVSHELVPVMLKDYGLEAAIQDFCRRFEGTSTRLHCRVSGLAGRLESHLELALYRMGQELVNNIMKHSGATEALLLLAHQQEWIVLEAQDNGRGFVPEVREAKGIGLKMIRDRVELLNGTLSIATPAGGGSRITICVPLAGKKA